MPFEIEVDLTNETPESLDARSAVPPGWHPIRLVDVSDDENKPDTMKLVFEVTAGRYAGKKLWDRIKDPATAENDNDQQKRMQHVTSYARRLGLIRDEDCGKRKGIDWYEALNNDYVGHVETRSFKGADGTDQEITGLAYLGVYPVDYPAEKLGKLKNLPVEARALFRFGGTLPPPAPVKEKPAAGGNGTPTGSATANLAAAASTPAPTPPATAAPAPAAPSFDFGSL